MTPEEAIETIISIKKVCEDLLPPKEQTALDVALIILIAFNNTLKEVSK